MSELDITGRSKAEVLMLLVNGATNQVGGPWSVVLTALQPPITLEQAELAVAAEAPELRFDYVEGRSIKTCLRGDCIDVRLYDRDNGEGAAARALGLSGGLPHV